MTGYTKYEQAREDFEYLESLAELNDQVELDSQRIDLMQNPTKAKAAELYVAGIRMWFSEQGLSFDDDPTVNEIEDRWDV